MKTQTAIKGHAYQIVKAALKRGELVRPQQCPQCGYKVPDNALRWLSCFIKGHHDDYSKPLNVRWLCGSCHKRYHLSEVERLKKGN